MSVSLSEGHKGQHLLKFPEKVLVPEVAIELKKRIEEFIIPSLDYHQRLIDVLRQERMPVGSVWKPLKHHVTMLANADQHIDDKKAKSLAEFLDGYDANAGNLNTKIYTAGDAYLAYARGILCRRQAMAIRRQTHSPTKATVM